MTISRRALTILAIGMGSLFIPAQPSEAGIIDWMRCAVNPWRWPCSSCRTPCEMQGSDCPPFVQEGAYCNPCQTSNTCEPCAVSYVRRSYVEPRTRYTTQYSLEARPTYVRRRYWDPCTACYKTYYETSTSYVRRRYCVPVTDYVERSYLEPVVNCVKPTCPTPCSPSTSPEPSSTVPSTTPESGSTTRLHPVATGMSPNTRSGIRPVFPSRFLPPAREPMRSIGPNALREIPLATSARETSSY